VRDNGIIGGDVWFHLKDFSLILATIVTSLANFLDVGSPADDMAMMDVQDVGDAIEEETSDGHGPQVVGEDDDDAAQKAPALSGMKKKKKKNVVADSWDDDLSSQDGDTSPVHSSQGSASASNPVAELPGLIWQEKGGENLGLVLSGFRELQQRFDDMFKKVWA
jgi:hypothetical protein